MAFNQTGLGSLKFMKFKKLGVVLSGGGGKGAYQIGVWNAMREQGLASQIAAVAGTSVGGLNGAMMAQDRYELAEKMWLNVENYDLLTLEGMAGVSAWLSQKMPASFIKSAFLNSVVNKGLFKREGLLSMIAQGVDAELLASSSVPLTVTWHHGGDNRVVYRTLDDASVVADALLATAALPMIFDEVRINGELYSDGGFYWGIPMRNLDNTPVRALQAAGCDTVIVVCLSQDDLDLRPLNFPGMRIIPIVPRNSPGNALSTLDFSNASAARRMEQGYADGKEILRHLGMYLATNEGYLQLWEQLARNAAGEADTDARVAGIDAAHRSTVDSINSFDKIVASDQFDLPLHAVAADEGRPASLFELENEALLSELERERIQTNVDRFVRQCGSDGNALEQAVLDTIAALAPVPGRAAGIRDQGRLSRIVGTLTGRNEQLAADNQLALAEGQYALMRLVNAVQRQNTMSLEFSCVLQNRVKAALQEMARQGQRHNDDLQRVYRSMAQVYGKFRDELMQQGARLDALERQGKLLSWLVHFNVPRYHGRRLADLAPCWRLAALANEFYCRTGGSWNAEELMSAREMCHNVGLEGITLSAGTFFADLQGDRISARTLMDQLVTRPLPSAPGGAASWLLELRDRRLDGSMAHTVACWNYDAETELNAWDLLVEILYHMRAAGLVPIQHDSAMAALKERWLSQFTVLDKLVADGSLPAAFKHEIDQVRRVIDGFRLKVPLVGKFSAGKSSLINCWLDREVQQIDLAACTAAPVEFHYAVSGQEKLVIQWATANPEQPIAVEEYVNAYMTEQQIAAYAQGRRVIHIERHCDIPVLHRYPDLIVVDTPGIGSVNIDHDTALAHYLGDGVLFILCANRGQIGTEEQAFLQRQKQLGQEFSLLVCQEDLNNPSERQSLQRGLAEQAGLAAEQLVRGCSARERDLAGFEDLLAHADRSKASLFVRRHSALVVELTRRAECLLEKYLQVANEDTLRQRLVLIERVVADLNAAFQHESQAFLSDCGNSMTRSVVAELQSFMRSRRNAYVERIVAGQEIRTLVVADAQNAVELSTRKYLTARIENSARAIERQADIGRIGRPEFRLDHSHFASSDAGTLTGAVPANAAGGVVTTLGSIAGYMLPGLSQAIVIMVGGLLDGFLRNSRQRAKAESQATELVELACSHVGGQVAHLLEVQAREALENLRKELNGRIQTEQEQAERIATQLREQAATIEDTRKRVRSALDQVRALIRQGEEETGIVDVSNKSATIDSAPAPTREVG